MTSNVSSLFKIHSFNVTEINASLIFQDGAAKAKEILGMSINWDSKIIILCSHHDMLLLYENN